MNFNSKKMWKGKKLKNQCHLSKWGECVYGAQSWNERRSFCASMFVIVNGQTLIQKNGGQKSFSYKAKASMSSIPIRRMYLWCPITNKQDYYVHPCLSWLTAKLDSKEMVERKAFLLNQKRQCHLYQWGECNYGTQLWKKRRLFVHQCLSHLIE